MKKKLLVVSSIVAVFIISIAGYVAWTSRNTAQIEAKRVMNDFAKASSSQWYCENGYGKGIDNHTSWWEEIYVSNAPSKETAKTAEQYLKGRGYVVSREYVDSTSSEYDEDIPHWQLKGVRDNYSAEVRISSKKLTTNNCFEGFSNMDKTITPENYNSLIVINFEDNS